MSTRLSSMIVFLASLVWLIAAGSHAPAAPPRGPNLTDPGTPVEKALAAGLDWLVKQQAADGHWSLDQGKDAGQKDDVLGTALGLLPFMGAGRTHKPVGKNTLHAKNVDRGLKWLLAKQDGDGKFSDNAFSQAVATLALCEAYGMTADPQLKAPAQRAVNFLVGKQKPNGSWDGIPKAAGPGAAMGAWHLMAVKSAHMDGLNVPDATFVQYLKLLDAQEDAKDPAPAALAAHMVCRRHMGWGPRHPQLQKKFEQLGKLLPDAKRKDIEYYFFATQVLYEEDLRVLPVGEPWKTWDPKIRDLLVDSQDQREEKGSWSPVGDSLAPFGGRLMQTALSLLILEVNYRYLPVFRGVGKG
jgi:Prenyltransferase and squalene oxidase repeat